MRGKIQRHKKETMILEDEFQGMAVYYLSEVFKACLESFWSCLRDICFVVVVLGEGLFGLSFKRSESI